VQAIRDGLSECIARSNSGALRGLQKIFDADRHVIIVLKHHVSEIDGPSLSQQALATRRSGLGAAG